VRIGSLFSGYGGLDLGVQAALGGEVAWHVEFDKAPSRILDHHWPTVPNYGDVTDLDFRTVEPVDILTGGYPCQPFSHAGKRKGTNDERHLWPHVLRALRHLGPRLAILENVRGHLTLGFDTVLADLADLGWSARWGVVRASDAGACHQRARLFIVAYPDSAAGPQRHERSTAGITAPPGEDLDGLAVGDEWTCWAHYAPAIARWERVVGRSAPQPALAEPGRTGRPRLSPRFVEWMMGLPDGWVTHPAIGISRNDQLKALGNGVVPQQAALALGHLLPVIHN
jgi:DNA (cytosine-5)-methyltransferase 1